MFPPSSASVIRPALLFFSEKPFIIYFNYLRTRVSAEEGINSSIFLVFIIFLNSPLRRSVQLVDATLQARDLC